MLTRYPIRILIIIACFVLLSNHALVAKDATSRVKNIIVSPGGVNDDGSGAELCVKVSFVEPAPVNDVLKLTIIPGRENAGEAQWKDKKSIQFFQIRAKDSLVEVKATIHIIKNGTIGIKAETSSTEKNDSSIYWMPVTLKAK